MIKPTSARSCTSLGVACGGAPPFSGSLAAPSPAMKKQDSPTSHAIDGTPLQPSFDARTFEPRAAESRAFDLRAARTDRLTAFCLWLALFGPTLGVLGGDNQAHAALPTNSQIPQATRKSLFSPTISVSAGGPVAMPIRNGQVAQAALTAAIASPNWRNDLPVQSPRARSNDGSGNPHPTRAMFPLSLLAKARASASQMKSSVLRGVAVSPPAEISKSRLISDNLPSKPGPRGDVAVGALPYVWKGGLPTAPTLLADAKEQIKTPVSTTPDVQLPPLPEKSDGTPDFSKMGKVVNATALKLPPPNRPLPPKLQEVAVPADTKYISSLPRLAQAGLPGGARPSASPSNQIDVTVSTFVVLIAPDDLQTVAIADPTIADVVVVNSRAVLVNGKAPGATSLVIVDKKIRQYNVQVVPSSGNSPSGLADSVASAINLPDVQVRAIRGSIVLNGQVANADEQKMAGDIAGLFADKVVNLTQIRPTITNEGPGVPLDTQIKNAIRTNGVEVRVLGKTVLLEGQVASESQRATAEAVAKALANDLEVVNLIRLPEVTTPAPTRLTVDQVNDTFKPLQGPAPIAEIPGVIPAPAQPMTRITARQVADQIILEGTALTADDILQAEKIAARTGLSVVSRVLIAPPAVALSEDIQSLNAIATAINRSVNGAQVFVSGGKQRLVLTGTVPSTNSAVMAEQIARSYSTKVDNLLVTPKPQQVDVDISVLEINKSDLKNLGLTFTSLLDSTATNPTGFVIGQGSRSSGPVAGGVTSTPGAVNELVGSTAFKFLSPFQAALRAEVTKGNARILSNPRTTVLSGRTATFKVGGEVPIPGVTTLSGSGNATTSIIFKPFGILLDVTPVATDDGVITAQIRTEVSQPDFTIGVVPPGGGGIIPGFSQRQAQTEVTIEPGGTLALGGLISNNITQTRREVPLLSRIPVLGSLFSSKRFQKNETELVVFVTPRLLESKLKDGQLAPARPVSVGESEAVPVKMGINGIPSFTENSGFAGASSSGGSGGSGGGQ